MCLAIPGQIKSFNKYSAKIDFMGVESEVNIELIENPKVGEYILVHAGCAIQKIDVFYFEELQNIFYLLLEGEIFNE